MAKEQEEQPGVWVLVTGIHIDLMQRAVTLTSEDDVLARLSLAPEGVVFEASPQREALSPPSTHPSPPETPSLEREKPQTLQGRLKSKPKPGRADRNNQPTAWARFAAHVEGEDGAVLYSTTFHRHTAPIALGLEKDAQLTVQGYPHPVDDPSTRRMDTLSVINLLDYPGKPGK